jgi:hypothetical protein
VEPTAMIGPHRAAERLRQLLSVLERRAEDVNPFLIVIIIGLAVLNASVFTALELSHFRIH